MSIILAKILGLYFLSIGLAFIINPDRLKNIYPQIRSDQGFIFLGGVIALLIGATIVSLHNIWILDWPVIITILGWWSLFKGFAILAYPNFLNLFSFIEKRSETFYRLISIFYVVLGLFLLYKGFYTQVN